MSKPIIGVTVGTTTPRANLMQTDPKKADYVKGKEEFLKHKHSWKDLPDKPVVLEGTPDTVSWDGNTEGRATFTVNTNIVFYKVSAAVPNFDELPASVNIKYRDIYGDSSWDGMRVTQRYAGIVGSASGWVWFVDQEGVGHTFANGDTIPEPGTYFMVNPIEDRYTVVTSLTIPGYTGFATEKFDPAYLYQPDWNQTDEAAPDFVKNKPFYSKVTDVLPETTVAIDQSNLSVEMKTRLDIVDGGTYTVNWNGTEYVCVAKDVEQFGVVSTLLGNYAYNMGTGDTGEPFMIAVYDEETAAQYGGYATCIYAFDGSASVTLSVMGEVVKKLDKKYLPEYLQFGDKIEGQNSAVTWDGNTEGLPNVGNRYYKISDYAPAFEDFAGGCVLEVTTPDGVIEEVHPAGDIIAYADGLAAIPNTLYSVGDAAAGVFVDGLVFPEPGLYVMNRPERAYVSSVTIPGYTFGEVKYTTIDPKYLPDIEAAVMDVLLALGLAPVLLDGDGAVMTEDDGTLLLI